MNQWYVKDLSKLTGISVQTLHHYDRIDLLKPSVRLSNGYRVYSEKDLLKLQQIIALKFFGFELVQIEKILTSQVNVHEHFEMQARFLKDKADTLLEASRTLSQVLSECDDGKSIPWKSVIALIEIYRLTQKLEKTWAGEIFSANELKQYAQFKSHIKYKKAEHLAKDFELTWVALAQVIQLHLAEDPASELGLDLAKQAMGLINDFYGKENANLRHTIWVEGFKKGNLKQYGLSVEGVNWLDQAFNAYFGQRILTILNQIGLHNDDWLKTQWHTLMEEMYGDSQSLKQTVIDAAMTDERVSIQAREWLLQKC